MKQWMEQWLKLWASFLVVGIEGEEGPEGAEGSKGTEGQEGTEGEEGSEGTEGEEGSEGAEGSEGSEGEEGQETRGRGNEAIRAARKRAQDAEAEVARVRAELEAQRRAGSMGGGQQSEEQKLQAEEDARLERIRTSNPEQYENERWRVSSNRTLRAAKNEAQQARFEAAENADRMNFRMACSENPRLKAISADVEKELQRLRSIGQNAPREGIARYILGDRVLNAKPAAKKKPSTESTLPRGQTPASRGARSDVNHRNIAKTEREKRAARLEGKTI